MSKPWGGTGAGAWALEAERAEAEERELAASAPPPDLFPSLKDAASTKPNKKKNKGTTFSLSEFTTGTKITTSGGSYRRDPHPLPDSKFLTHDELLRLPTGPKDRSPEELENTRLGGGFRSYGGGSAPRRPYGGGFDDDNNRRGGPPLSRLSDLDLPSRADEADNWATGKKEGSLGSMDASHGRQDRYGLLGSGGSSKADEADSWVSNKKPVSQSPAPSRYSGFGSGFRDPLRSADSDRWARGGGGMTMTGNGDRELRERPRLVLDPPKGGEVGGVMAAETGKSRVSPFGAARPREEVLAEKGLDWKKIDTEIEGKKTISRPTSSQSSRPSSGQSSRPGSPVSQVGGGDGAPKGRAKVNPFGDARPREVLLEEKGRDWRKIDSELERRKIER